MTPTLLAYVAGLPIGRSCVGNVIEIAVPKRVWVAYVESLGGGEPPDWRESTIPDRGRKGDPIILLRIADLKDVPSAPDRESLDSFIASARGADGLPSANGLTTSGLIVIADATFARMFYFFAKDGEQIVIPYQTIDLAKESGGRLPERYDVLARKKVGIAGCGSLGSKIAASLARSGVREFVLVDDDILKPGNLIRHELDADSVGAHKAEALEGRLKAVAVGVKASARRVALGGQELSGTTELVLDELAACDLVIDATADPQAFNFVASVARGARRPMVWAEVYAGGIGGFVARLRPDHEPPPHAARRQYLAWCREQGVPWLGHDHDYGAHGAESEPLIADDGDVSVIAAHASRMAIDALVRPEASLFPHPAYVIGLSSEWIFEGPFDTRPIDFVAEGSWPAPASPERTVEALDFMASLFEQGENADRTGT